MVNGTPKGCKLNVERGDVNKATPNWEVLFGVLRLPPAYINVVALEKRIMRNELTRLRATILALAAADEAVRKDTQVKEVNSDACLNVASDIPHGDVLPSNECEVTEELDIETIDKALDIDHKLVQSPVLEAALQAVDVALDSPLFLSNEETKDKINVETDAVATTTQPVVEATKVVDAPSIIEAPKTDDINVETHQDTTVVASTIIDAAEVDGELDVNSSIVDIEFVDDLVDELSDNTDNRIANDAIIDTTVDNTAAEDAEADDSVAKGSIIDNTVDDMAADNVEADTVNDTIDHTAEDVLDILDDSDDVVEDDEVVDLSQFLEIGWPYLPMSWTQQAFYTVKQPEGYDGPKVFRYQRDIVPIVDTAFGMTVPKLIFHRLEECDSFDEWAHPDFAKWPLERPSDANYLYGRYGMDKEVKQAIQEAGNIAALYARAIVPQDTVDRSDDYASSTASDSDEEICTPPSTAMDLPDVDVVDSFSPTCPVSLDWEDFKEEYSTRASEEAEIETKAAAFEVPATLQSIPEEDEAEVIPTSEPVAVSSPIEPGMETAAFAHDVSVVETEATSSDAAVPAILAVVAASAVEVPNSCHPTAPPPPADTTEPSADSSTSPVVAKPRRSWVDINEAPHVEDEDFDWACIWGPSGKSTAKAAETSKPTVPSPVAAKASTSAAVTESHRSWVEINHAPHVEDEDFDWACIWGPSHKPTKKVAETPKPTITPLDAMMMAAVTAGAQPQPMSKWKLVPQSIFHKPRKVKATPLSIPFREETSKAETITPLPVPFREEPSKAEMHKAEKIEVVKATPLPIPFREETSKAETTKVEKTEVDKDTLATGVERADAATPSESGPTTKIAPSPPVNPPALKVYRTSWRDRLPAPRPSDTSEWCTLPWDMYADDIWDEIVWPPSWYGKKKPIAEACAKAGPPTTVTEEATPKPFTSKATKKRKNKGRKRC